jgi:hypothetical protein
MFIKVHVDMCVSDLETASICMYGMWWSDVSQIVQFTLYVYLSHHFCGYWVHYCDTQL